MPLRRRRASRRGFTAVAASPHPAPQRSVQHVRAGASGASWRVEHTARAEHGAHASAALLRRRRHRENASHRLPEGRPVRVQVRGGVRRAGQRDEAGAGRAVREGAPRRGRRRVVARAAAGDRRAAAAAVLVRGAAARPARPRRRLPPVARAERPGGATPGVVPLRRRRRLPGAGGAAHRQVHASGRRRHRHHIRRHAAAEAPHRHRRRRDERRHQGRDRRARRRAGGAPRLVSLRHRAHGDVRPRRLPPEAAVPRPLHPLLVRPRARAQAARVRVALLLRRRGARGERRPPLGRRGGARRRPAAEAVGRGEQVSVGRRLRQADERHPTWAPAWTAAAQLGLGSEEMRQAR